jgi:hypothetical protein
MDIPFADLPARLTALLPRTRTAFAADATALAGRYAPGKWTARQFLFHIVDVDAVMLDRLRRALADAKPLLWALDPERWTARLAFPERSLAVALAQLEANRAAYLDLLASVTVTEQAREAIHSEKGALTIARLGHSAVWHHEHHLEQVEAILAGRPWPVAG